MCLILWCLPLQMPILQLGSKKKALRFNAAGLFYQSFDSYFKKSIFFTA
tara:strand:+ start:487 stop:633 length:147 start_codon:yes stop_codon:yes gene_type:complete